MGTLEHTLKKRETALKVADTVNNIRGVPVSEYAQELSDKWVKGEITEHR